MDDKIKGAGLLEVMLSLMLIAIVLLGFDSIQLNALHANKKIYDRAILNQDNQNQEEMQQSLTSYTAAYF